MVIICRDRKKRSRNWKNYFYMSDIELKKVTKYVKMY